MLMDDVYDLYFSNAFTSDIVDGLSQKYYNSQLNFISTMVSDELVHKRIKKVYTLDGLH